MAARRKKGKMVKHCLDWNVANEVIIIKVVIEWFVLQILPQGLGSQLPKFKRLRLIIATWFR